VLVAIRAPYDLNGARVDTVGTSIGIALYPQHGAQAADLLKAADAAMYEAKQAGKNTYRFAALPIAVPKTEAS
jgi:diguanylate cyclase (GGDEF)-like protein